MISEKENPVEWGLLLYELEDAKEHLENLISKMVKKGEVDEIEYKIDLSHIYSHLNRGWASRNHQGKISDVEFESFSQFPDDLTPV